jgi:hypothetical protein
MAYQDAFSIGFWFGFIFGACLVLIIFGFWFGFIFGACLVLIIFGFWF